MLLAATDTDAARESLEAMLARGGHEVTERSYRDSDYLVDPDGVAAGVVDDFVAIGPEALYKRTVDAAEGDSLADADEYADAVEALPGERLALFWADTTRLLDMAVREDPLLGQLRSLASGGELPQIAGAFMANGDRLELEMQAGEMLPAQSTPLLQELPGDSWAAFGAGDVGTTLRDAIDRFGGALGGVAVRGQLRSELGLDLDRDLLDWIGHTGFFVRGTTPGTVDGGLVIQPTDDRRASDAFGRIVGAIQQASGAVARPVEIEGAEQAFAIDADGSPRPIVLARGAGLVVATSGAGGRGGGARQGRPARRHRPVRRRHGARRYGAEPARVRAPDARAEGRRSGVRRGPPVPRGVHGDGCRHRREHRARRRRAALSNALRPRRRAHSGTIAGIRAAATSSSTAGTSSRATTSWI